MQKRLIQQNFSEVGLAPIVAILLIAFVLGGFLIYQKQSNKSSNLLTSNDQNLPIKSLDEFKFWHTYTDPSGEFSFRFPPSWGINYKQPGETKIGVSRFDREYTYNLTVSTNKVNFILPSEELTEIPIKLDDQEAIEFYFEDQFGVKYHIVQKTSNPAVELKMDISDEDGMMEQDFTKVLSTFKFTN